MTSRGAIFVMPRRSTDWADAPAIWTTAAGWAAATRKRLGGAWVLTRDVVATPEQTLAFTRPRATNPSPPVRRRGPVIARILVKDVVRYRQARTFDRTVEDHPEWAGSELAFVWQHHDPFHRAGEVLARRHGCPLVSYVHAPQVWEAREWGVKRRGWGWAMERFGERPPLLASDVVACVSEEVARELVRLGVEQSRILVSPMAVDAERFSPEVSGIAVRERFELAEAFVVGWTGSFRTFHGLDTVLEAFARLVVDRPNARLLLVGSGPGRGAVEEHVDTLGLRASVVFTGAVSNEELPAYLAAMDVALVSAPAGDAFHYSPIKLREYLAMGLAVAAPAIGDIARTLSGSVDAVLYQPGDVTQLARQLDLLACDLGLRTDLGSSARRLAVQSSTWDARLAALLDSNAFHQATG